MNKLIDFNKIAQESVPIKDVINLKNIVDKTYSCEPYPPDSLKSVEQSYKQQTESQSDILENTMVPVQRVDGQQVLTERSSSPVTQGFWVIYSLGILSLMMIFTSEKLSFREW